MQTIFQDKNILICPECSENMTVLDCRFNHNPLSAMRNRFHIHFRCMQPDCGYETKTTLLTETVECILKGIFDQYNKKNTVNSVKLPHLLLGIQCGLEPVVDNKDSIFDIH